MVYSGFCYIARTELMRYHILCFGLLLQALLHASVACRRKLVVEWVAAGDLEDVTAKEVNKNPTSALQS